MPAQVNFDSGQIGQVVPVVVCPLFPAVLSEAVIPLSAILRHSGSLLRAEPDVRIRARRDHQEDHRDVPLADAS